MTEPREVPGGPAGTSAVRRASRGRVLAAAIAAAVLAAGIVVWLVAFLPGLTAADQTQVMLDARPFVCKDEADVTTYTSSDDPSDADAVFVSAMKLHPGLDCTMGVLVRNDSDVDVSVDRVTIPLAGASNGVGVHADHGYTQGVSPTGGPDALDAVFDYEHDPAAGGSFPVGAHTAQRFSFHLSWSDGCMDHDTADTFVRAPTVVVAAGPWHVDRSWNGPGYAFLGGKHTVAASCTR